MWGGKQAFELFGEHIRVSSGLPGAWSGWDIVSYCLHTAVAEELLIVAIPVAVLTKLRVSLRYQVLVVFALRVLIHLYYGWPAVVFAGVWTLLLVAVYVRYRSVWPSSQPLRSSTSRSSAARWAWLGRSSTSWPSACSSPDWPSSYHAWWREGHAAARSSSTDS